MEKKRATQVDLIPDPIILAEARIQAGERAVRMAEIANLFLQDPVLSLEFLQSANSVMFAGNEVTSVEAAVMRLGTDELVAILSNLNNKKFSENEEINEMFEVLRFNCRRTSIIGLIVATVLNPALAESVRISSLFCDIGHMAALIKLGTGYLDSMKESNRKTLPFRLKKDHKLDLERLQVDYLEQHGVPERLVIAYDRTKEVKSSVSLDVRLCVQAALELVEAHCSGKFDKYSPDENLPSRSSLRLLNITRQQHERLYGSCSQYLKQSDEKEAPDGASFLIFNEEESSAEFKKQAAVGEGVNRIILPVYTLSDMGAKSKSSMQGFLDLCDQDRNPEEFKTEALSYLTTNGLYQRGAIIRVSSGSDEAVVESAMGTGLEAGSKIDISDPLSPLKCFRVDIRSAQTKRAPSGSPFGSSAYAMGPILTTDDGDCLLLYTDNTEQSSLTMDSRKIFRLALGLMRENLRSVEN